MQATVYANLTTRRLTTTLGGSAILFPAFVQGDKVRIGQCPWDVIQVIDCFGPCQPSRNDSTRRSANCNKQCDDKIAFFRTVFGIFFHLFELGCVFQVSPDEELVSKNYPIVAITGRHHHGVYAPHQFGFSSHFSYLVKR